MLKVFVAGSTKMLQQCRCKSGPVAGKLPTINETNPLGLLFVCRKPQEPALNSLVIKNKLFGYRVDTFAGINDMPQTFDDKTKCISFSGMGKSGVHRYGLTGTFTEKPVYQKLQKTVRVTRKPFFLYQPWPMRHPLSPQYGHTSGLGMRFAFPRAA